MKYLVWFLLLLIPLNVWALEINSQNAVLYNLNDGEILFEKGKDEKVKIASLTKIMTAIVAIENIDNLNKVVRVPEEGLRGLREANASVAGFKVNDYVTYLDLLYAMLLPSGADAVQTLTYYIAGGNDEFVQLMNEKAQELGLQNTHFANPTGLNSDNHYSTVEDVSKMLRYALENETFKEIFTTREYRTTNGLKLISTMQNYQNKFGIDTSIILGSKTGFTDESGYCLASMAIANGVKYLLVTTGADTTSNYPLHVKDAIDIYEYYINNYHYLPITEKNQVLYEINSKYSVNKYQVKATENIYKYVPVEIDQEDIEYEYQGVEVVSPFTKKGTIGNLKIILDDEVIEEMTVSYDGSLKFSWKVFFFHNIIYVILALAGILLIRRLLKR